MTFERIAGVWLGIVFTSTVAMGQQSTGTIDEARRAPVSRVYEVTYPGGGITPWRVVQSRTESNGRETMIETIESLGVDQRFEPFRRIVTETVRGGADTVRTGRNVFEFSSRQGRLLEAAQEERDTSSGQTRTLRESRFADADGRLRFGSRHVEEIRSVAQESQQTERTTLVPGINEPISESERVQYTERRVDSAVVRHEASHAVRDVNGRWQVTETRSGEIRDVSPSERLSEETVHRRDTRGELAIAEQTYTRRSQVNGREHVDIETYSRDGEGVVRSDGRVALSQRVRRTTTPDADGGNHTVEEVEGRNPAAPSDPMQVIRRTVTTVRQTGPDRWTTEIQVFALDRNGRLTLVFTESEDTASR